MDLARSNEALLGELDPRLDEHSPVPMPTSSTEDGEEHLQDRDKLAAFALSDRIGAFALGHRRSRRRYAEHRAGKRTSVYREGSFKKVG